jgi:hypothetical protein
MPETLRKEIAMPYTPEFYSINEAKKPKEERVHHNNSACGPGGEIPRNDIRYGKGPSGETPYRLCDDCEKKNKKESEAAKKTR